MSSSRKKGFWTLDEKILPQKMVLKTFINSFYINSLEAIHAEMCSARICQGLKINLDDLLVNNFVWLWQIELVLYGRVNILGTKDVDIVEKVQNVGFVLYHWKRGHFLSDRFEIKWYELAPPFLTYKSRQNKSSFSPFCESSRYIDQSQGRKWNINIDPKKKSYWSKFLQFHTS